MASRESEENLGEYDMPALRRSDSQLQRKSFVKNPRSMLVPPMELGDVEAYLEEECKLSGYLYKLNRNKRWDKRYWEIKGPFMSYWKSEAKSRNGTLPALPDAAIDLRKMEKAEIERGGVLVLTSASGRTYSIKPDQKSIGKESPQAVMQRWLKVVGETATEFAEQWLEEEELGQMGPDEEGLRSTGAMSLESNSMDMRTTEVKSTDLIFNPNRWSLGVHGNVIIKKGNLVKSAALGWGLGNSWKHRLFELSVIRPQGRERAVPVLRYYKPSGSKFEMKGEIRLRSKADKPLFYCQWKGEGQIELRMLNETPKSRLWLFQVPQTVREKEEMAQAWVDAIQSTLEDEYSVRPSKVIQQ